MSLSNDHANREPTRKFKSPYNVIMDIDGNTPHDFGN